jgi:hypothetical protein
MENVDLALIIRETLARFTHQRTRTRPLVFVMISADVSRLAWADGTLAEFVRQFLYEALLSSNPDAAVEVLLRRRTELRDMNDFVGIHPSYWAQLRVSGWGLKRSERRIEDIFSTVGYRLEEWVGGDNSDTRLGIFGSKKQTDAKMVLCLESTSRAVKCDLLLPIFEDALLVVCAPGAVERIVSAV